MSGFGSRVRRRSSGGPIRRRFHLSRDDGAALIEFAVLAPLLLLLVLGIIEFGWLFGQYNDVRHGAREGARFAAVDAGTNTEIRDYICSSMDGLSAGMTAIDLELTDGTSGTRGEIGSISVTATVSSLTNAPIITTFLPSQLQSEVEFRLEQNSAGWSSFTDTCP